MSELFLRTTRGTIWSLAENFSLQFIQLLISIILARLLLPEQFGLIGILVLFIAVAQSLLDSGFGSALIQKKNANELDSCSIFYFNLLIGIVLTLLLYEIAPFISRFYGEPILTPLMRVLSLNILIGAFSLVPSTLLTKRIDFKSFLKVSLTSIILSGFVGVGMALKGMGVWSLATQSVIGYMLRAFLLWWISKWRPKLLFSFSSLKTMFVFGSRMMLSGFLDTLFQNIYQPLIGKVYSTADVGYYVRAQSMQNAAIQPAGSALGRVIFPALSIIQDEPKRMNQAVRKIMTTTIFFHFPLMTGLIVVAQPLIILLMTERWAPSVPYFQLFCIAGFLYPLHVINLNVLIALGKSDLFFD